MPVTYVPDLQKADGVAIPTIYDLNSKDSVYTATTENVALSGLQTIDGVAVPEGARVLVKQQDNAAENGIWVVQSGAWYRPDDADTWDRLVGAYVVVLFGTTTALSVWVTDIWYGGTINYDGIGWTQLVSALSPVTQGRGVVVAGSTVHAVRSSAYVDHGIVYANSASGLTFLNPSAASNNQFLSTTGGGTPDYRDVVLADVVGLQTALNLKSTVADLSQE